MTFLDPTFGAAAGAEAETPSRRPADFGIDDRFRRDLGEGVTEGGSALFVVVRKSTRDKLLAGLDPFRGEGKALQTSLSQEGERKLRDLLDKGFACP